MPASFRLYGPTDQEFAILRGMKPASPSIGRFKDHLLYDSVEDQWGRRYRYVGICEPKDRTLDSPNPFATVLGDREFILPPGIIYRMM